MSQRPKLRGVVNRVVLAGDDGVTPAREYTVQPANPDLVLWERTRQKHGWPEMKAAASLWITFTTWAASRRLGLIPTEMRYEDFEKAALECLPVDGEDDDNRADRILGALVPLLSAAETGTGLSAEAVAAVASSIVQAADDNTFEIPPTNPVSAPTHA